ncbi:MAG: hypothetical protein M1826_002431 [Phylliscum demangeonii]|nr:MAG: hypothetical protein M1826_002431 [Phylliscum demangeonii]
MSAFYFGGSDSSDVDDESLPYPKPLQRSAFLAPDFSPVTYLSTLHDRHQTLEDLRAELRDRSQELSKELLELLNTNYDDFLHLGIRLHGGEEKVESVKVGLLAFQKELEAVRKVISERERETRALLDRRRMLRRQIARGRTMLDLDGRLEDLEHRLRLDPVVKGHQDQDQAAVVTDSDDDDEDEDEEDGGENDFTSVKRLKSLVQDFLYLKRLQDQLRPEQPVVAAQAARVIQLRNTLLLDLHTALKQAVQGANSTDRLLTLMGLYREMNEPLEAVRALKSKS